MVALSAPVAQHAIVAAPRRSVVAMIGTQVHSRAAVEPLQLVDLDGAMPAVPLAVDGTVTTVAWAPDGKRMVVARATESLAEAGLLMSSGDGQTIHALSGQRSTSPRPEVGPQWSHDGGYLLTVRLSDGGRAPAELWLMRPDATDARRVSTDLTAPQDRGGLPPLSQWTGAIAWSAP